MILRFSVLKVGWSWHIEKRKKFNHMRKISRKSEGYLHHRYQKQPSGDKQI